METLDDTVEYQVIDDTQEIQVVLVTVNEPMPDTAVIPRIRGARRHWWGGKR